ncbi:MAG: hypothetical protein AB8F95_22295 [Bacteroidia bacterium]
MSIFKKLFGKKTGKPKQVFLHEDKSQQKINLQNKAIATAGKIEFYYFENENIGLKRTLFHTITVPFKPFDSGLEYEAQPVETELVIEWLNLDLLDPTDLDGVKLSLISEDKTEASIYIGYAHNPCDIKKLSIQKIEGNIFELECRLFVNFEFEGVASGEELYFKTQVELNPQIRE